ncbi:TetR/AcrR family transcriptional regulator [Paenibacillus sp. JX-17]|uniref:TetR/AcrR family transcriptional regulator n=1 Tax=Paenibacillus lacisoli TaxID=3064525 RepID=A0ABT9CAU2_9BACL|nr:TetR/AcrR family transcriptional regulator [Paenibacillus sp. JX-17]MDO7906380.1 TetR/AcrR family transcriptional regulator [Paenibacillus sp. JX-17]
MGRSKEFDEAAVLRKAMEVFGQYGYDGTSLPQLLSGLGIARQSLYDTYGTKRDLFISAVKHYTNEKSESVITLLQDHPSVKEAAAAIFHEGAAVLKDERRRNECFIIHSAMDRVPHDEEIAAFFNEDLERLGRAFEAALLRGQEQGEIADSLNVKALSDYLVHARYALISTAKMTSAPAVLDHIVDTILLLLDR